MHPYFEALLTAPANSTWITIARAGERTRLTAQDIRRQCQSVAVALGRVGVQPGDVVLLFLSHQVMLIPAFLGCQWASAVPAYMPPLSPRQDRRAWLMSHEAVIAHVRPRAIIADPDVASLLSGGDTPVLTLDAVAEAAEGATLPPPAWDPDAVCLLQHSSGTTGLKKGVQLSYRAVMAQIAAYAQALELAGDETVVSWLPVYHDMGLIACTVLPTVRGLPLVSLDPFEWLVQPTRVLEEAAAVDRALVWLPNFAFNHLARHARRLDPAVQLGRIRALIDCSEPCRPESFDAMMAAYAEHGLVAGQLQTCFAMAENVFAATQTKIGTVVRRTTTRGDAGVRTLLSCGRAIPGVEIEIRNADGRGVADGEIGEIHVGGASLFDGYYGQPDLTSQRLKAGWYASRDLGFLRDGELFVCGRMEDLIIVAGRNLYAHDIEAALIGIEGLKPGRAIAFGVDNAVTGTEDLVVAAEMDAGMAEPEMAALSERIRGHLMQVILATPREVVVLPPDTLIKTSSGKLSRDENRRRYLAGALKTWRTTQ